MGRRVNKIASQADAADVVPALSEAAGSTSSSAPIRATRGASAAFLAKEVPSILVPVATSSSGLRFRSFSPVATNAVLPASSSLLLTDDDLPPSNQLEVSQIVPSTMLPSQPGAMILPEVALPLNTLQVNTAYSLLRMLHLFCCENPGVLNTTSALIQLPPVGDAQLPYQVAPPPPAWPVPQLPLQGLSLTGDRRGEQGNYAQNVYVYHLINAATALVAKESGQDVGAGYTAIRDMTPASNSLG
jgi:hypothetical protein